MNTKIHTIKDIPSALFEGNPHEVATTAWWQWRIAFAKRFPRIVVIVSRNPDGSPLGWVSNEGSLVQEYLHYLRREGAYWYYEDEAHKAPAQPDAGANPASNAEEIEMLRAQVKQGIEREMEYRERLGEIAGDVTNALRRIATPTP